MALIFKDRVKETTTSTGQGTITLAGAVAGFRSFADIGNTNTTYYCIFDNSASVFEIGIGTYTASGTTLSRDTVLQTSAGNTTKINFSAGSKEVFCTYPAGKAVFLDSNGDLTINGTTYLNAVSNRWTKTATNNQTVFNGNDDAGTALSVNAYTQVFLNGIMLKETTDYALSNNNTITLTSGVSANDILESITFAPFNVANVLQPNNNLNDVASASTALTNLGGMPTTGGTFSGNVSLGSNDLSTTGKILFANMYATTGDLPSATTYHGMFAHVHATGKAYFAHGGSWIPLANESALSSYLTTSSASSTYLTQSNASSTYLTQASASSTYAPLAGGATFTGEITANGGINEDHNAGVLSNSNQTLTLDAHNGNNFSVTTSANITSFVVSNLPPSGTAFFFTLKVSYGGSHSITWPSAIKWHAGTAPTLSTSGVDIFAFYTIDSGTTIYGFTSAQGLA